MKSKTTLLFLGLMMVAGTLLTSCRERRKAEILKPVAEHLIGKWLRVTDLELKNGEWVEDPIPEGVSETVEFRADGTTHHIKTKADGCTAMITHDWTVDEEACVLSMSGVDTPIFRLTDDEFGFSYNQAKDSETGELIDGGFRWIFRRMDAAPKNLAERLVGRWIFSKTYEKKNGEWMETSYGRPDEGWHEYRENGSVVFHSRKGDRKQESEMVWNVNCTTGEMHWCKEWGAPDFTTVTVLLDGDDTLSILYSKNYDPATGKVEEGEFKDVLRREK